MDKRASGVLMHVTSLPSPYGIGTFGQAAYDFIDFLVATKQTYWQILPLTTTSYGDSPYQSFSAFAGNTHLIDLDLLAEAGWLHETDYAQAYFGSDPGQVDYAAIFEARRPILEKAVQAFLADQAVQAAYQNFLVETQAWLPDYAEFMALKEHFGNQALQAWPDPDAVSRVPEALTRYRQQL